MHLLRTSKKISKRWYTFSVGLCGVFLTICIVLLPSFIKVEFLYATNPSWITQNTAEKRILIWDVAVKEFIHRPLFGYGVDSFRYIYADYFENHIEAGDATAYPRKHLIVDRAHNYLLDLLIYSGLAGFAVWLVIGYISLKNARKSFLLAFFIIYFLWIQVQINSITHLIIFWGSLALSDT